MPETFSRLLHPFDAPRHPCPEPEVKRALLAWTADRAAETQDSVRKSLLSRFR